MRDWYDNRLDLYKIFFNDLVTEDFITFTYQKIAKATESDARNFRCSKQAEVQERIASHSEGEAIMYHESQGGERFSNFSIETGLNGNEIRSANSNTDMRYNILESCGIPGISEIGARVYVGWVVGRSRWVVDLGAGNLLDSVTRSSWPESFTSEGPDTDASRLRVNHSYSIHEHSDQQDTYGAIFVEEIHPAAKYVRFKWKRIEVNTRPRN